MSQREGEFLAKFKRAQDRVNRRLERAGSAAMHAAIDFCEAVMGLAARKAPIDLGDLRGAFTITINGEVWAHTESDESGAVRIIQDRSEIPTIHDHIVIRVGVALVYALRQHEEMDWNHPKGGEAKYFEKAVNELSPTFLRELTDLIRKGAKG